MTQLQPFPRRQPSISDGSISPPGLDDLPDLGQPSQVFITQSQPTSRVKIADPEHVARIFQQLPAKVIQRILWTVDADTFASLSLLNREWYAEAQNLELYAHHLSRCPSYALTNNVITGPFRRNDLFRLKTRFAAEVRRNLFEAYMRPRETLVNLISINANSSAAFPGGEAFRFAFSPNGQTVLALSSSRIYVLDVTTETVVVRKELKTLRKPLSASITDDGSLLAVLSSRHQANIYGLTSEGIKHLQVLVLDNPPRTIALTHEGTVLAAAYEGGVEVFSLAVNALSTDRRAVRSEAVDTLTFSGDGSMLVGSSQSLDEPHAVVVNAPFYTENDPNLSSREIHSRMWTTQILFPQISSICSHAELLQGHSEGDGNWLFAYDHALMSYRAVRTDDTRSGVAYFLNPATSRRYSMPMPSIAPTASACGTLVVAGFSGLGLWIYGVPERLDVSPDMGSVIERHEQRVRGKVALTSATGMLEPLMAYSPSVSGSSEEIEEDSLASKVDWRQSLFVKCRHLKSIEGYAAAKWVERPEDPEGAFPGKRLVIVAPGGVNAFAEELGEESMPVDGSRICLLDFIYSPSTGGNREITVEVGENEPELLTEHTGNLDVEVALERRRTVRGSHDGLGPRVPLGRSITTAAVTYGHQLDPAMRLSSVSQPSSPSEGVNSRHDSPMLQGLSAPPPGLQRAATATGLLSARFPPRPPLGSTSYLEAGHVVYNRPNERRDPEEGWESPPPPYSTSPQAPSQPTEPPTTVPQLQNSGQADRHSTINLNAEALDVPSHGRLPEPHIAPADGSETMSTESFMVTSRATRRASTTLDGVMTSDRAPMRRTMNQFGGLAAAPRARGISESSLDTVVEPPNNAQERRRSIQISPIEDSPDSISPLSPGNIYNTRSRPLSYDQTPPRKPLPMRANMTSPMSLPTPIHEQEATAQGSDRESPHPSPAHQSPANPSPAHSLTLSGANLQNRLNHPVPPTPDNSHHLGSMQDSRTEVDQPGMRPLSQGRSDSFTFVPPTADQMANLDRRMSLTNTRNLSITTDRTQHRNSGSRDFGPVPPSPPRAAWGAAGVPGSPSFNKAMNSPNGLTRSNSRPNSVSMHNSSSTPDLRGPQRPKYGRLDTIDSIGSSVGHGDHGGRSRSQSVAIDTVPTIPEQITPLEGDGAPKELGQQPKWRKGRRKKGEEERPATSYGGREKKGSRCTVM